MKRDTSCGVVSGDGGAEISVRAPLILLIKAEPCQPCASEETGKSTGVHQNNTSASLLSCPVAMDTKHPVQLAYQGPRCNTPGIPASPVGLISLLILLEQKQTAQILTG